VGSIVSAVNAGANGLQNARVLVRLISLDGCPESFGVELTRAANTQNRVESKDFAAQDPMQSKLRADLFLELKKEYVYRSGDNAPLPENGCTFEEAAVALACAHPDISHSVQSKREVGKLWEDITKSPYTTLFNHSTNPLRLWRVVEIMRIVDSELKGFQATLEGKQKLIAIHGNRLVLHMVFRVASLKADDPTTDLEPLRQQVPAVAKEILEKLFDAIVMLYPSAYPSNLFKNLTKCKELAKEIASPAAPPQSTLW
jgi:hypothetical protein